MPRNRRIDGATILALQLQGLMAKGLLMLSLFCLLGGMARSTLAQCERNRLGAQSLAAQQARLESLRARRIALSERRAFLLSDGGIVVEARRFNWLRPDERRIWLTPTGAPRPGLD